MKLKAGIIGLGVGEAHIQGYHAHPDCEVIALCDFSAEKRERAGRQYPSMLVTASAEEILEDPDIHVVSIASYDQYHYEQIARALQNGKHVFVEKPLCLYEKEARHIDALLKQVPRLKLSSNLILRQTPRFRWLKGEIEAGRLGNLFYIEGDYRYGRLHKLTEGWRGQIDYYSVIYGGAVHMVDLLLWLTREPVIEVMSYGNQLASKGSRFRYNDMTVSILKFQSGLLGKVTSNFGCVFPHFHGLSVYGTKATFVNDFKYGKLFESRDPKLPPREITAEYPGAGKGALLYDFIDSIIQDGEPEVSRQDVFDVMSVCFAMEKALRKSAPVKVDRIGR